MDIFMKCAAGALVSIVLYIVIGNQSKDFSLLITLVVCCMLATVTVEYLAPVIIFFDKLKIIGNLDGALVGVILKTVGIGFIGEITSLICIDAGNSALGKTMQFLTAAVILCISVPLFESILEIIEEILVTI
jgi:stage III sporulation protein AD